MRISTLTLYNIKVTNSHYSSFISLFFAIYLNKKIQCVLVAQRIFQIDKVVPGHVVASILPHKEKARHKHAAGTPERKHAPKAFAGKNPNGQDSSGVKK